LVTMHIIHAGRIRYLLFRSAGTLYMRTLANIFMGRFGITAIFFGLSYVSVFGQTTELIKGRFNYSMVLNDFAGLNKKQKKQFTETLDKLDTVKIDQYFKLLDIDEIHYSDTLLSIDSLEKRDSIKYAKAEALIASDKLLAGSDTRMISALYTCYVLNKNGLLDYYYISLNDIDPDGTKNIFLTEEQLKKIKPMLGKEIDLNVQFVIEAKWTKFKVYKLVDK
jgi:hypothetical protein